MRTILTLFFMTLAAQVSADDWGSSFKCYDVSMVDWSIKDGFSATPKEELSEQAKIRVTVKDGILSLAFDDESPEIFFLEAEEELLGRLRTQVFTHKLNPEFPSLISKVILEDPNCDKDKRELISFFASRESLFHSIAKCEC